MIALLLALGGAGAGHRSRRLVGYVMVRLVGTEAGISGSLHALRLPARDNPPLLTAEYAADRWAAQKLALWFPMRSGISRGKVQTTLMGAPVGAFRARPESFVRISMIAIRGKMRMWRC